MATLKGSPKRRNRGSRRQRESDEFTSQTRTIEIESEKESTSTKETEHFPYLNREASWLEFNWRVLHEAIDARTPLLERVKFLGIFTSNLDEFFMKRVGGLKKQVAAGVTRKTHGMSPTDRLKSIREKTVPMLHVQRDLYRKTILPQLVENGIHLLKWKDLNEQEKTKANKYFRDKVFPVLTPLAVDPGHPFPFLSNLSISLGVTLSHPDRGEILFARVKVPQNFPRWIRVDGGDHRDVYHFVSLQELIEQNLQDLFPNMKILSVMPFRITRNADIERDEEDAEDLLEMIEEELRQRRFASIVRLEHGPNPDPVIKNFLVEELGLTEDDVYEVDEDLDLTGLYAIYDLNIRSLKFEPWVPVTPLLLADEEVNIFNVIRRSELLVHHPFESFSSSIERFIRSAAEDPRTIAIKMTLYRTDEHSPFIQSLIRAAEHGKQVVCLIELKARFDEQRNITWAQKLEDAGVHVVYGIVGLKTHAKIALVVREDQDGLRSYVHIGTGNYHTGTARLYTDLGYLTCKPEITDDVVELFHYLTGRSLKINYKKLLVAPVAMQDRFIQMIDREAQNKAKGLPSQIICKMNAFDSKEIGRALYKASQGGVPIDLIIRGFCTLVPGVSGISENIKVISLIGRFLEHSRIYYFRNAAQDPIDGEFYIGSSDWMDRNLLGRVEAITPIEDRTLKERCWEILQIILRDRRQVWEMQSDGGYLQRKPANETEQVGTHQHLMKLVRQSLFVGKSL